MPPVLLFLETTYASVPVVHLLSRNVLFSIISAGTTGKNCSTNFNDCKVGSEDICNTVDTAAGCIDDLEDYQCVCGPDYTGKNCTMSIII